MIKKYYLLLSAAIFAVSLMFTSAKADAVSPEENYKWYCTQCHGAQGKGDGINATPEMPVSPRNHTDGKEMAKLSDDDLFFAVKDGGKGVGKSSLMPPWGATLSEQEIKELAKYLRKLCNCTFQGKK